MNHGREENYESFRCSKQRGISFCKLRMWLMSFGWPCDNIYIFNLG